MFENQFYDLTSDERDELGERIAGGEVVADHANETDAFNITLDSGRRVSGLYRWGMDDGEYVKLVVSEDE